MDQELIAHLDRRFEETTRRINEETARQIGTVREEFRTEIRQLGVTVEGLRTQIQTVAEGVVAVDEKLERFRHEVRGEFDEVKAMIKFSYAELDRRIGHLELRTRDLEARVERLEVARP
jgi:predicted RNase H-like nuclease (RuvC/YqgF family)